ncbi:PrpF domain-containing protein [Trichoderma velutinum]
MAHADQYGIPCAYIRGGTSKAMFFHGRDIPPPGPLRDTVLKRLMGSPDAQQVDGMGGRSTHTSKIAIVRPSDREGVDVDFTFAQVSVDQDLISYKGNCGNISSAVGPFAIDEGLMGQNANIEYSANDDTALTEVRIFNTNTQRVLLALVPVDKKTGFSITTGDSMIAGVPGTSAPILMDYKNAIGGSRLKGIVPTGRTIDTLSVQGKEIDCDMRHVGLTGSESAKDITTNAEAIALCKEIRGRAAQLIGMCADWELVDEQSPGLPFVILVAPPTHDAADLTARVIFMNRCHDSIAGTAAVGVAACSRIPNSVLSEILREGSYQRNVVQIRHPEGIMPISVKTKSAYELSDLVEFDILAFERTSRRIMSGSVFIPKMIWNGDGQTRKEMFPKKTHLLMTGDINLLNVEDSTEPFRRVVDSLSAADIVISNLECVLGTPEQAYSIQHEGFFANPIVGADALCNGKIAAVGLANNINYGARNILGSIATLDKAGIPHTGAGANIAAARKPVIIERGGRKYGFLQRTSVYWPTDHAADATGAGVAPLPGHTAYESHMYRYHSGIPPVNRPGIPPLVTTWVDPEYLAMFTDDIKSLRPQVDVLVASCHWGLGKEVLTYMEQIAKAAIDAGADVVMGHGPHHPLPISFYKQKPIFYGLGSFSFHMGHLGMAHGDWVGLLGSLEFHEENSAAGAKVSFRFVRHSKDNETYLCHPEDEKDTVAMLVQKSQKYGATLWVDGDSIYARPS